jgi:hypothetical protein
MSSFPKTDPPGETTFAMSAKRDQESYESIAIIIEIGSGRIPNRSRWTSETACQR